MTVDIEQYIQHLKGIHPYGRTEAYKLWEAFNKLADEINSMIKVSSSSGSSAGAGAYTLIDSWTYSVDVPNIDFINLTNYKEILLICRGLTASAVVTRFLRYSTDNGSNFDSTVGNYLYIDENGFEFNDGTGAFAIQDSNTVNARSAVTHIQGINLTTTKVCHGLNRKSPTTQVWPVILPINALRIFVTSGNITGGLIQVYGK